MPSTQSLAALRGDPLDPALLAGLAPSLRLHLPAGARTVPFGHLPPLFAAIPPPRTARGRRFAWPALLSATLAALLSAHLSQLAVAEWLADQAPALQRALGFHPGHTPHQSPFNRVLRRFEPTYLAAALHQGLDPPAASPRARGSQGVGLDGKAQRGRLRFTPLAPDQSAVHEVSAFCAELGTVLAAAAVTGSADKAAAELHDGPHRDRDGGLDRPGADGRRLALPAGDL